MTPTSKSVGHIIIAVLGALAILGTAWRTKGTEWNDTGWFYAFCVWLFLHSVFEVYSRKKGKKQ